MTSIINPTLIPGVELKQLQSHIDERGFFREIIRQSDGFFKEGFGQWSHSYKRQHYHTKQFHIHQYQVDWWYCPVGIIQVVLYDTRFNDTRFHQFQLPQGQMNQEVLRIPPGVAHGFKVLHGPAHLLYITSKEYNPEDEGRLNLEFDWNEIN